MIHGSGTGVKIFAVFLAAHWLLFHFWDVRRRSRAIFGLTALCLAATALRWANIDWTPDALHVDFRISRAAATFITFGCLWFLYMPFYYTIQTSISIAMLIRVIRSGDSGFPVDELKPATEIRDILHRRLETMTASGYLHAGDGGFRLTGKGRFVARVFAAVKEFWRLGPGG